MEKLTHDEILKIRLTNEQALKAERHPITLIVDNVRSLYNIGSIFRTSDSALIRELILCGFTPHPPRIEIEKTALGATESVPWKYFKSITEAINYAKNQNNKVFAVEITDSSRSYDSLNIDDFPLALIVGNELTGLSKEAMDLCDEALEIKMYGVKHSLNVAVATGIVLFEALRVLKSL
jgi:23S rRNA (guanosine2251-2'-O)-methyltransferase